MRLIIGLGNPGEKYKNNRHNVGHLFIDWLQHHSESTSPQISRLELKLVKTSVFMNQSGTEIKRLATFYKLPTTDLFIIHDDLDIPLGMFKIQKSSGPKLHNGIASIEKALKTKEFWRVRIGVDNPLTRFTRLEQARIDGETYVLQDFTQPERKQLLQTFDMVVDKLQNVFHNELIP